MKEVELTKKLRQTDLAQSVELLKEK